MLILSQKVGDTANEVVIRDETGRLICEIGLAAIRGDKARLSFNAPKTIHLNRRQIDETKTWGGAGTVTFSSPCCTICKCPLNAADADSTRWAHRACAERELQDLP